MTARLLGRVRSLDSVAVSEGAFSPGPAIWWDGERCHRCRAAAGSDI